MSIVINDGDSAPVVVHNVTLKHGSHNQASHGKGGKGGSGSAGGGVGAEADGKYGNGKTISGGIVSDKNGNTVDLNSGSYKVEVGQEFSGKTITYTGKAPTKSSGGVDWVKAGKEMPEPDFFAVKGVLNSTPFAEMTSDRGSKL